MLFQWIPSQYLEDICQLQIQLLRFIAIHTQVMDSIMPCA